MGTVHIPGKGTQRFFCSVASSALVRAPAHRRLRTHASSTKTRHTLTDAFVRSEVQNWDKESTTMRGTSFSRAFDWKCAASHSLTWKIVGRGFTPPTKRAMQRVMERTSNIAALSMQVALIASSRTFYAFHLTGTSRLAIWDRHGSRSAWRAWSDPLVRVIGVEAEAVHPEPFESLSRSGMVSIAEV